MATELTKISGMGLVIRNAVGMWADVTTRSNSARRGDLIHDKSQALIGQGYVDERTGKVIVAGFFTFTDKPIHMVTAIDVKAWQAELEHAGLSPSTVYARISRLSSFYNWAMKDSDLSEAIRNNPVDLARPKAPKAYQTESAESLTDDEMMALLSVVRDKADGDIVGKRDYAMLLFYLNTGMRRAEVCGLKWGNLRIDGTIVYTVKVKDGDYLSQEVEDLSVKDALLDYLEASGRLNTMATDSPLWTRHDRAGTPGGKLSSHSFVKNFKRYAEQAGIGDVHLHQMRHTYARIVGEIARDMSDVQEALGHKSRATTTVYLRRIGVKKDKFSKQIAERFGL